MHRRFFYCFRASDSKMVQHIDFYVNDNSRQSYCKSMSGITNSKTTIKPSKRLLDGALEVSNRTFSNVRYNPKSMRAQFVMNVTWLWLASFIKPHVCNCRSCLTYTVNNRCRQTDVRRFRQKLNQRHQIKHITQLFNCSNAVLRGGDGACELMTTALKVLTSFLKHLFL